ncbi:hypothetical protein BV378_27995 [Nostoc sp. RF31YmG]|nr:hypothetical protein BV378_27995 [Nostoc sp. RF31YmG]OUL35941.1 hypothetical protein BV375_00955 [Nostoc sp. 106C]
MELWQIHTIELFSSFLKQQKSRYELHKSNLVERWLVNPKHLKELEETIAKFDVKHDFQNKE